MKNVLLVFAFLIFGIAAGAQSTAKGDLAVYPNPAVEYISVNDNNDRIGGIAVYNLVGKKVKQFEYVKGEHFYVADLPKGMYLVQISDRDQRVITTQKMDKR